MSLRSRLCRRPRLGLPLLIGLAIALASCSTRPVPVRKTQFHALNRSIHITLAGTDQPLAQRGFAAARQDFTYIQTAFDPWRPGPMGRTNELLAMDGWFSVNPSVLPLIVRAKALYRTSDGLFNPAIGHLVALWGFRPGATPKGPPSQTAIKRLLAAHPSMDDIQVKGIRVRSTNRAVRLDMSGLTMGYAVGQVIAHLRSLGVRNALVNAGDGAQAIGSRGGHGWTVALRNPLGGETVATLDLDRGESVFTSGIAARHYRYHGHRYRDIIDPRTGHPAQEVASATVLAADASTADAAARALLIAGPKQWYHIARSMGIKYAMLMARDDTVYMNPAMARRLHFVHSPAKVILSKAL